MQSVILLDVDKSDAKTTSIHLLPCHIEYDGEAAIETFFNVEKETDEGNDPTSLTEKATVNSAYLHAGHLRFLHQQYAKQILIHSDLPINVSWTGTERCGSKSPTRIRR